MFADADEMIEQGKFQHPCCIAATPNVQLWKADQSAQQAREVRFVHLLGFLKVHEELFREFYRVPTSAQLGHELELPRDLSSAATDVASDHAQLGFSVPHALPQHIQKAINAG